MSKGLEMKTRVRAGKLAFANFTSACCLVFNAVAASIGDARLRGSHRLASHHAASRLEFPSADVGLH
jgi:hypothetical protein